jgi:hypothetical protein
MRPKNQIASDALLEGTWLKAFFLIVMCLTWVGMGVVLIFKHGVLRL